MIIYISRLKHLSNKGNWFAQPWRAASFCVAFTGSCLCPSGLRYRQPGKAVLLALLLLSVWFQRAVLVPALEGRDLIARAKTGTGKTLAFGIPIIKRLTEDDEAQRTPRRHSGQLPRALVLAPTSELAKQVEKEIKESAPHLSTVCVYGGISYVTQQNALSRGVDVVVGTPGHLIDLINGGSLQLTEVQFLVLDEADQMLAVGFEEDVEVILEKLPTAREYAFLCNYAWHLDNPLTIDLVGEQEEKLAEGIKFYAISATSTSERTILSDLVTVYAKGGKAIVFTQTKRDADEVSMALTNSIASEALHWRYITTSEREDTKWFPSSGGHCACCH